MRQVTTPPLTKSNMLDRQGDRCWVSAPAQRVHKGDVQARDAKGRQCGAQHATLDALQHQRHLGHTQQSSIFMAQANTDRELASETDS